MTKVTKTYTATLSCEVTFSVHPGDPDVGMPPHARLEDYRDSTGFSSRDLYVDMLDQWLIYNWRHIVKETVGDDCDD